ncbi:TIR domain-containing protein [Spirosoma oryzicola]|uniref:TIR domain-containing protein n=1 Tax=Spirosoma oryzicola TaxID=2898794 RepID=UPI001E475E02|nr:TIR domain-containing protein [Spirosoma oryzicola]UHG91742.1 TIR domain-containing protein [Spirosoma oryzicola]
MNKTKQIEEMFRDVFISHAREDSEIAEQIYDYLESEGYSPWLDKRKLRPGANWDYEIRQALKRSDFVIVLLSSISVSKRGYVQREFKLALEYAETKLEDDYYILPILIDECAVPEGLSKYQWIEINKENFMADVLESLNIQRDRYIKSLPQGSIELNQYTKISIPLNRDIGGKLKYHCEIPQFYPNRFFDSQYVNTVIQHDTLEIINDYRGWIGDIEVDDHLKRFSELDMEINFSIYELSEEMLSIKIIINSFLGGAHPNTQTHNINIAFKPDRKVYLNDVVVYKNLTTFVKSMISRFGDKEQRENLPHYAKYIKNTDFTIDDKNLYLDFTNHSPRVILSLANLDIPLHKIELKVHEDL